MYTHTHTRYIAVYSLYQHTGHSSEKTHTDNHFFPLSSKLSRPCVFLSSAGPPQLLAPPFFFFFFFFFPPLQSTQTGKQQGKWGPAFFFFFNQLVDVMSSLRFSYILVLFKNRFSSSVLLIPSPHKTVIRSCVCVSRLNSIPTTIPALYDFPHFDAPRPPVRPSVCVCVFYPRGARAFES